MKKCQFDVDICETLKQTITVKASNKDEAQKIAEAEYIGGKHVLGYKDFSDVHFIVKEHKRDRGIDR